MKAIVYEKYGSPEVLTPREVKKPVPGHHEVLIKIHAASLNAVDWRLMRARPFLVRLQQGLLNPKIKILGADVAGRIEAVGKGVTLFQPGDAVFGDLSGSGFGGFAEYVTAPETVLAIKPSNLSFEEAAAVPLAGVTALQGLRNYGKIQAGQKVLINGASGGVGTFAVQLARLFEAEVTAVCSTGKIDITKSLGADTIINYTKEDVTKLGTRYDLIFSINGYHPIRHYQRILSANGIYVMAGGTGRQILQAVVVGPLLSRRNGKKLTAMEALPQQKDLLFLKEYIENEKIKPVIDRIYPLEQLPQAMRYIEEGHASGKVVVTI